MTQVALVGNITDDPELSYTQSGAALAGFTIAVSHQTVEIQVTHGGPDLQFATAAEGLGS